eukprot:467664-Rhodomonas_salina.1
MSCFDSPQKVRGTLRCSVQQCKHDMDLGPAVDSASPLDIQTYPAFATLTAEPNVYPGLNGIIHGTTAVPQALC